MLKHLCWALGVLAVVAGMLMVPDVSQARPRGGGGGRGGWGGGWGGYYGGWGGGYYGRGYGGYYGRGWGWGYPGYYGGYRSYYPSTTYYYDEQPAFQADESRYDRSSPQDDRSARVDVNLPRADAQLTANGKMTRQRGTHREFDTNPIDSGKTYTINFEATWMENGRQVKRAKKVTLRPGQHATVDFAARGNNREVDEAERTDRDQQE